MIHFDQLPNTNPAANSVIPKGTYYGTISKAEMRQGKDPSKPPYLSLTWDIKDKTGKAMGKLFDIITEPTADLTMYKLKRFIVALQLPITGDFMLKDLVKIVMNKTCILDVTIDDKTEPHRNAVNVFKGEIYYPTTEANNIFAEAVVDASPVAEDNGLPWEEAPTISAPDAEDSTDSSASEAGTDSAPESNY